MQLPGEHVRICVKDNQSVEDKHVKINWLTPTSISKETKIIMMLTSPSQRQVLYLKKEQRNSTLKTRETEEDILNLILGPLVNRSHSKIGQK